MTSGSQRMGLFGGDRAGGPRESGPLRLLVVDEVAFDGGLATFRRNLMPALARKCERLLWVVPDYRVPEYAAIVSREANVSVVGFLWPRGCWRRLLHAASRRLPECPGRDALVTAINERLHQARVHRFSKGDGFTHCLCTAAFGQPVPDTTLPIAGVVLDLNPCLNETLQRSILSWVRQADTTLTISDFTRKVLIGHFPEKASRIHSIPLAAPPLHHELVSCSPPVFTFYYPAVANPHKGHLTLFRASLELARTGLPFRLVLTGDGTDGLASGTANGQPEIEEARRLLERNPELRSRVSCLGKVPDGEVEAAYAGSTCVVLPSTYEGFGLPLSEALRHGVPIICTDIPPFREQIQLYEAGDDATLFPPGDHRELAQLMALSVTHRQPPRTRQEVRRRLARWTWDDVANRYVECLQL